jgi:hypothetical protein
MWVFQEAISPLRGNTLSDPGTRAEENQLKHAIHALALVTTTAVAVNASATTLTFNDLAVGTLLASQYAGVVFSANAMVGAGFATNTDMTIVSATGSDVGFDLGQPHLVTGNLLRAFSSWLNETGDPSFRVSFATPITSFSADFAGVYDAANVHLLAYDGGTLLSTVVGTSTDAQFTLSVTGAHITSVIVLPGTFEDYVAFDNMQYASVVPEPSAWALCALGLGLVAWTGQRRRRRT